jgi:uncharacterized glyoxalase superfamily protein PhnB
MATPKLDLIGIVVADMGQALQFYREVGLNIPDGQDDEGHVEITLDNGLRIAWDTYDVIRSFMPNFEPPKDHNAIGLAFLCDSPADVDATYERLIAKGYNGHLEPFDTSWGQHYAQVEDPDGNVIDFFCQL